MGRRPDCGAESAGATMTAADLGTHIKGSRRSGTGYKGKCPAHDDQQASLSWADGEKGTIVKCFAGCEVDAIMAAMGLPMAELFADPLPARAPIPPVSPRITAQYRYTDEAGALLYEVVRYQPKGFRQRCPDGKGGWTWSLNGVRRVLYRLPEILGRAEVVMVEGEKDADRLWQCGISATTNAGGSGGWQDGYAVWLQAHGVKTVVILPDNDPAGDQHAQKVAASCRAAGLAVKTLRLPGLLPKGDVSDWLDAGHSVEELQRLLAQPETPMGMVHISEAIRRLTDRLEREAPEFLETPFSGLNALLGGGLFPGELYYLAAKGGEGKSALAIELARHISRHVDVLVISQEMGLAAVVRRFMSQQGQINATRLRQHTLTDQDWAKYVAAAATLHDQKLWIADHAPTVKEIVARVEQLSKVKLVIVDYLQLLQGEGRESRQQIEAVSKGLKALAKSKQLTVFCLSAVASRGEGGQRPSMSWLRGSQMLEHDCDVALLLHQPNPPDPTRELMIAKARDAQCGSVKLCFAPDIVHFVEQTDRQPPSGDYWEQT